jgi:hypothetical protein
VPEDRNLFTQIGLDSGSLTMLGAIVHSFKEPGEYRCSVSQEKSDRQVVFYIVADKESSVAQVTVDLAALMMIEPAKGGCDCESPRRFTVNPQGYVLFHVSAGAGGYYVHARSASDRADAVVFDSRRLTEGDLFTATILRPGKYEIANVLTDVKAEVTIAYPKKSETRMRVPAVRAYAAGRTLTLDSAELKPGQGLVFECKGGETRLRINLIAPDDGPRKLKPAPRVWTKPEQPLKKKVVP